jgi:NitT/TauT family transport system ATP-binding protein
MSTSSSNIVRAAFIPLLDAAIMVVAAEKGFARNYDVDLRLTRENSWANIRDRVSIGHFEVAHMLAPLPIASTLGVGHLAVPMVTPMALGQGGGMITVSTDLWQSMASAGATRNGDPVSSGLALREVVKTRARVGKPSLTFGMVYPFSTHNYVLRYWLAASGIDPDHDVRLVVIPPPFTVDALTGGHIDGFCVGDPWNSIAVDAGVGRIATTKVAIWQDGPDKVLGMREEWAQKNPDLLARLLLSFYEASLWCDDIANQAELAHLMAGPRYLDCPPDLLRRALSGKLVLAPGVEATVPDFLLFGRKAATFPWLSHALWLFSQMVRWGQVPFTLGGIESTRRTFRPDLYRAALSGQDAPIPSANAKVEGALAASTPVASSNGKLMLGPDRFFDGLMFDPERIQEYIAAFPIQTTRMPLP